jgi:hypothetical protein
MRVCRYVLSAALIIPAIMVAPTISSAQIAVSLNINIEPPELPVYDQAEIPGPGYLWTPGYWAYGPEGYFWVPGTWVEPPTVGMLWTPGYWGFRDGYYAWNDGYWGPHIGFYGGVNYGFGYVGVGYLGGAWRGGVFKYNTAVTNIGGARITTVYNETIVNNTTVTNVSFNGGARGTTARPNVEEQAAARENHVPPTAAQTQHVTAASTNRSLLASVNQGKPAVAATSKPGEFSGRGVIAARTAGADARGATNAALPGKTNTERSNSEAVHPTASTTPSSAPAKEGSTPKGAAAKTDRSDVHGATNTAPVSKPSTAHVNTEAVHRTASAPSPAPKTSAPKAPAARTAAPSAPKPSQARAPVKSHGAPPKKAEKS